MLKEHHPPVFPTQFSGGQSILYVPFVWPAVKSGKMGAWHENWQSPKTQQPKNKKKKCSSRKKILRDTHSEKCKNWGRKNKSERARKVGAGAAEWAWSL